MASDTIRALASAFLYTTDHPDLAEKLIHTTDLERLAQSSSENKLMTLGALLLTGKLDQFDSIVAQLDFDELPLPTRMHLASTIFSLFGEEFNNTPNIQLANPLLRLLTAICPTCMQAHEQLKTTSLSKQLIELDYANHISPNVKGTVFFRETVCGSGSRKHEFGLKIQQSLSSQSWKVDLCSVKVVQQFESSVIQDFALIDLGGLGSMPLEESWNALNKLRRFFKKIILIEPDPWAGASDHIISATSDIIDYIWGFTADWGLVSDPAFKERSIVFPNVGGFDSRLNAGNDELAWDACTFNFTGSIQVVNLNRAYWVLESIKRNLPIRFTITEPWIDDGLDTESSLNIYAQQLASAHACINFTTRNDSSKILTVRAIEVISLQRLLIQESCPAFHRYYVEGEHFMEFSTIGELQKTVELLQSKPYMAKKICSQGHHYYQEKYSSRKLVEHIQTWL